MSDEELNKFLIRFLFWGGFIFGVLLSSNLFVVYISILVSCFVMLVYHCLCVFFVSVLVFMF